MPKNRNRKKGIRNGIIKMQSLELNFGPRNEQIKRKSLR